MKEFIFGGLLAVWFLFMGLSSFSIVFTIASIVYPIMIAGILYNIYLAKRVVESKRLLKH